MFIMTEARVALVSASQTEGLIERSSRFGFGLMVGVQAHVGGTGTISQS
jgi:hypothetical protein